MENSSRFEPVLVVWQDAYDMDDTVWTDYTDEPVEPCLVYQVGFLLADTSETHVVLVSGFAEDKIQRRMAIPVGMVRSITPLQAKKR